MNIRSLMCAASYFVIVTVQIFAGPYDAALMPEADYDPAFIITPNGDPALAAPMVLKMLGAGDPAYTHPTDPTHMGGGRYTKVGLTIELYYTDSTEGPTANPPMRYLINRGWQGPALALPPDVASLNELPELVRFGPDLDPATTADNLASWATLAKCPRTIAGLEWSRYYNLPITFQLHGGISHGGNSGTPGNLDWYIESLGKNQCMWDVADICDPNDDNPATLEDAGAGWGSFSFATPTLADPVLAATMGYDLQYQSIVRRNLHDAVEQLLRLASHPRYAGRIAAIAIDPEIHLPAHRNDTYSLPQYPSGTVKRPFVEDYHPVMVRQFANYLKVRYGDATPLADSNGDGVSFWGDFGGDYTGSGWPSRGHDHGIPPATWEAIDPPRSYPPAKSTPRTPYWQEWCNFRTEVIEAYLESLVDTIADAGMPPTRIFTHQPMANASYLQSRTNYFNEDWLDDYAHIETSRGMSGISQYQPYGVEGIAGGFNSGFSYYLNLKLRDDSWGAPEYNPALINPIYGNPVMASLNDMNYIAQKAWDRHAHVLWAHYWGAFDYPVVDCYSTYWVNDPWPGTVGLKHPTSGDSWTVHNMEAIAMPNPTSLKALTANDSYIESPVINLNADVHPYLGVEMIAWPGSTGQVSGNLRMDFEKAGQWYSVPNTNLLRYQTSAWDSYTLNMASHPQWTGTISRLRFYYIPHQGAWGAINRLWAFKKNVFTTAFQPLMAAKKDIPRPAPPAPMAVTLPMALADQINALYATENLTIFGTDPVDYPTNNTFSDYGITGNFYPATVSCGGILRPGIVAPASRLLGMRKTGRFRQLQLPNQQGLLLSFAIGIEDGYASDDGVRFKIRVRDLAPDNRRLTTVFEKEWRWNQWHEAVVDLTPWAGRKVDLMFETHGIAKINGDRAVWGEPTLHAAIDPTQVWVDFSHPGAEWGTEENPFRTLAGGLAAVVPDGRVIIKPGTTAEHPRITQPVRLETAPGGPVRIGG